MDWKTGSVAGLRSTNLQCFVHTKKAARVAEVVKAVPCRSLEVRDGIVVLEINTSEEDSLCREGRVNTLGREEYQGGVQRMLRWNCSTSMGILNERELIAAVRYNSKRGGILGSTRDNGKHNKTTMNQNSSRRS